MVTSRNSRHKTKTRQGWKLKVELGPAQLGLLTAGFTAALFAMFLFGVLVGRGLPLTDGTATGLKAQLELFFGLSPKPPQAVEHAARTWEPPEKILGELTYHEDLTRGQAPDLNGSPAQAPQPQEARPLSRPRPARPTPPAVAKQEPHGYFTLMVSSLRNNAFAKDLVAQLKGKGYSPKLETVQMEGGGTWYRVLIGRFEKRKEAQAFAAQFNRKEKMKALVIRITP